jgi:glycosyltransferase involved in cell wall biosynthesis
MARPVGLPAFLGLVPSGAGDLFGLRLEHGLVDLYHLFIGHGLSCFPISDYLIWRLKIVHRQGAMPPIKSENPICANYRTLPARKWLFGDKYVDSDQVKIIPNAIDTQQYDYCPSKRTEMRKQLGLEGRLVVGHVVRLSNEKNHEFLSKVF